MISYLVAAVAAGWLLCGMPGVAQLRSLFFQSLACAFRLWLLLVLLGLPRGYLVLPFLALLHAGGALRARVPEAPRERGVEAEGIGISPNE